MEEKSLEVTNLYKAYLDLSSSNKSKFMSLVSHFEETYEELLKCEVEPYSIYYKSGKVAAFKNNRLITDAILYNISDDYNTFLIEQTSEFYPYLIFSGKSESYVSVIIIDEHMCDINMIDGHIVGETEKYYYLIKEEIAINKDIVKNVNDLIKIYNEIQTCETLFELYVKNFKSYELR